MMSLSYQPLNIIQTIIQINLRHSQTFTVVN